MLYESSSNKISTHFDDVYRLVDTFSYKMYSFCLVWRVRSLYQRLRLGADNKSTKQSPIDKGNNSNNNDDESIFHLVGGVETRKCHLARQKSVRTHCCRTLKILSLVSNVDHVLTSDIEFQQWVLYSLSHRRLNVPVPVYRSTNWITATVLWCLAQQ